MAHWLLETPLLWGVGGFAGYFYYTQFIKQISWNTIELLIAQHVLQYGTYVTSLDYPSALTWRPVVPTLIVAFVRIWTADPMLIYQIICGATLAGLAVMMFLAARLLWGNVAGHLAAFFTLTCPAITTGLINHFHSYSHLGALIVLGPALYCALLLLQDRPPGMAPTWRLHALSGLLWGLAYLSRSELMLFAGGHFLLMLWLHRRRRLPLAPLAAWWLMFLVCFIPYNAYADHVATRDGLLARKSIYTLYMSQGWADPPPDAVADTEGSGYAYAIKLYGDPLANGESAIRAFRNNLPAFERRVRLNTEAFYLSFHDPDFFPPVWAAAALLTAGMFVTGLIPPAQRLSVCLLLGCFVAIHFILIYHIDRRYLTVAIPALILLASGGVHYLLHGIGRLPRPLAVGLNVAVFAGLIFASRAEFRTLHDHLPRNRQSLAAMDSLGTHFRSLVPHPHLAGNREPHIGFVAPANSPIYPEDPTLLAYFSRTAWVNHGAEGTFPRGRFYSFRECADDYRYVPAEQLAAQTADPSIKVIADYVNPVLGRYYLLQLNP